MSGAQKFGEQILVTAGTSVLNVNVLCPVGAVYCSFLVESPRRPAQPGLCLASSTSEVAKAVPLRMCP